MSKFTYLFGKLCFKRIMVILLLFSFVFHFNPLDTNDNTAVSIDLLNNHVYLCDGSNGTAWKGKASDGLFNNDGGVFNQADYNSISVDDSQYVRDSSETPYYQYHKFDFNIAESVDSIRSIDITWRGYGGNDNSYGYSLWVKENSNYVKQDWGSNDDIETLAKTYHSISDNIEDIITNGHLYIAAQSDYPGMPRNDDPPVAGSASWIQSYYVEVDVSYENQYTPEDSFSVSYPSSVLEGQSFNVTVSDSQTNDPVQGANVTFANIDNTTDSSGGASFNAPFVVSDDYYTLSVSKEGYQTFTASILVQNDIPGEEDSELEISNFDSINENLSFTVTATSESVAVEGVLVVFNGKLFYTDESGIADITAPPVTEDTLYSISASKEGYVSAESSITVLDNESLEELQLALFAPSSVEESESFQVTITADSSPVEGVMLSFSDDTFYTNEQGIANILAPIVNSNKSILLSAYKSDYLSDETYVLVINTDSEIYPELVISSDSSVNEDESFTVSVSSEDDYIEDVLVSFNDDSSYTNSNGQVTFTAPSVESKTYFTITASKEGYISDSKTISVLDELETNIVLISPNGGENLSGVTEIVWNVLNPPAQNIENPSESLLEASICYKKDTGSWVIIAEDINANLESYSWDTNNAQNHNNYFIRIVLSSYEETWEDISDSAFSIYNAVEGSDDGWIYGNVFESNQNVTPVENAEVCVYTSSPGEILVKRCRYTDEQGYYSIKCSKDTYNVKISKSGFETKIFQNINVQQAKGTKQDAILNKTTKKPSQSIADYTISEEIKKGTIGGTVDAREEKQVNLYQEINVNVSSYDINSEEGVDILVSGDEEADGTKLIIYLGFVEYKNDIEVFYDGNLIEKTSNIQDFFSGENNNSEWILTSNDENSFVEQIVIVNIPHFSQHQITVKLSDVLTQINAVTYYAGFFILVAAMFLGIGFVRKRYY